MLEFLWPGASKSGGRETHEAGTLAEDQAQARTPAATPSGAGGEVTNPGSQPLQAIGTGEIANPRSPGPAESTELSANEQEQFAGDGDAAATSLDQVLPRLGQRPHGRRLVQKSRAKTAPLTPQQRLLLLDTWRRSGLPAGDFAALVGLSKHTLYGWKKKFDQQGPAGLMDQPRGAPAGSRLPDLTRRTILLLKESNPTWGCQRISDMLLPGHG